MQNKLAWLDKISFPILLVMAGTLGLAPFAPEPHIWEKLKMLADGNLRRPIDIFDLFLHGAPWILLILKIIRYQSPAEKA